MKVLIIRFSSIGDIVLTTPIVRCVKQQVPHAQVHFLTKLSFKQVVASNTNIDHCYYLDDLEKLIPQLRKEKYDYIIDLHHNIRSLRIKRALGCKGYSFPKLNVQKWLYVNFKMKGMMPDKSIVERYFETVKHLGVKNDGKGLDYFIPAGEEITNKDIPMSHWAGYVGCVIGGSYNTKKFPVEKWVEFCKNITYPVILLGGPEDREEGEKIAALDKVRIYNACGKFNLNESACMVKYARVVVSNDTGLMHIAAAFKKPLISLWGNTTPELGMFPYYGYNNLKTNVSNDFVIAEVNGLSCRPCSKIGFEKCPKGHFKCMNNIDNGILQESLQKYWVVKPK